MISDEELLLFHYQELDVGEPRRIAARLTEDAALQSRLASLVQRLDTAVPTAVSVPPQSLRRWRAALDKAAGETAKQRAPSNWHFRIATGVLATVIVVAGVFTLRESNDTETLPSHPATQTAAQSGRTEADRFERSLRIHLRETEQQLAKLNQLQAPERAYVLEKALLENRLYTIAADRANEPRYARALRGFAPVIERMRNEGVDESVVDATVTQLTFELNVMQARLDAEANRSNIVQSTLPI
jgi:hypothetical protein